jgi:glycosyltransferase involved in cell wall biosynthesis
VVTLVDHFLAEQRRAGHQPHLLAPAGPASWSGPEHHLWHVDRGRPRSVVPALHELDDVLRAVRPDVVHLHSFVAGQLGRVSWSPVRRHDVPVVYQPHAWSTELFRQPLLARAVGTAERRASLRTDVIVGNCRDEIGYGRRLGITCPGRAIGVAVDTELFRPADATARREARNRLGLDLRPLLLVLGRLAYQKGQDQLVEAWERLARRDVLLALVGPGDPRPLMRIAPREWGRSVRWFGDVEDVRDWLRAADVLVLPSRYETVGLVVAEAMSCGVPVVATDVHGSLETIMNGRLPRGGAVVPLGDMDALLGQVLLRVDHPELREQESRAARRRAVSLLGPAEVAARLEAAYREALALHPGHPERVAA